MKRILAAFLAAVLICTQGTTVTMAKEVTQAEEGEKKDRQELEIQAPSAILMEASTGKIIYEKDADTMRPPASVTKVMTILLIYDALESGKITKEDVVTVSEYAASMGGSQVFLEAGEEQTVDTLLKCIVVSSANDACVAMAEYIAGSEEAFVEKMNERAKGLGMKHTVFKNCNGLDVDGHETTAKDIALMSRELITKYPDVFQYTKIWMDTIVHKTKKGEADFGLSNTNKLIRQYPYATGLKTGSTGKAKFCISATAQKDGMDLIAVIMAAPDVKARFSDARILLDYGFSKCKKYEDKEYQTFRKEIQVDGGEEETVPVIQEKGFSYIDIQGNDVGQIKKEAALKKSVKAPVKKGTILGKMQYTSNGKVIGEVNLTAEKTVPVLSFKSAVEDVLDSFSL
nr:D-alanyl-D-alanine carboxypeptidase family protein [uncultured Sellimonas sp.]